MPQSFLQILTIPFSQTAPKLQTVLATGVPGTTVIAPKTAGTGQQVLAILSPQKAGIPPQQQVLCRISNLFFYHAVWQSPTVSFIWNSTKFFNQ